MRRACYALQLVLSGDSDPEDVHLKLMRQIEELSQVFTDGDSRKVLSDASHALIERHHYRALKSLRSLLPREDRLFAMRAN